jgi:osmoprotectant transport system ATP-binding protein
MAAAALFRLRHVVKRYGANVALEVDLALPRGATTVLLGPSGSGKSTLLRLLIGLLRPDSGEVLFDDRPLTDDLQGARRRMGYVIQEGGLFPHLTAAGNVALPARRHAPAEVRARIRTLAELVRLDPGLLERYPHQLSGGQRQRVGLMRALVLDPEALLLDEPFGALDPLVRADLQEDLRHIIRTLDKTVVLVTHDVGEAASLADEIVLLDAGGIVQRGAVEELLHHPRTPFVARFLQAQGAPGRP